MRTHFQSSSYQQTVSVVGFIPLIPIILGFYEAWLQISKTEKILFREKSLRLTEFSITYWTKEKQNRGRQVHKAGISQKQNEL